MKYLNDVSKTAAMFNALLLITFYLSSTCFFSTNFRGATISWSPSDKDGEVSINRLPLLFLTEVVLKF